MHLSFIVYTRASQMYVKNNVYKIQMCFALLVDCTDKCTGWWRWLCESTSKVELPQPRGSLTNNYTFACYRLSQSRVSTRLLPFTTPCQTHNNFCIFKFCVYLILYTRLFTKLNLFQIFTLRYTFNNKFSRSMVYRPLIGICNLGYLPVCSRIPERKFLWPNSEQWCRTTWWAV